LQRRDLELKTAATSFLIRIYAQVERERARERESERERQRDRDSETERQKDRERERERERCSQMQYTRQALVLRMKLDECDG
jgi:hypothetical protein